MALVVTYPSSFSLQEVVLVRDAKEKEKVGLSLKKQQHESAIRITGLTETSPLHGSAIRSRPGGAGQLLLAVNGNPDMSNAAAAAKLIAKSTQRGTVLKLLICEDPGASCLHVIAAPSWKHSPGINFGSTRGRTLVTISKIFQRGPFTGNPHLNQGDIVLAVNGIPVSKPEEADRALRTPMASSEDNATMTVLHVLNVQALRAMVMNAVDQKKIIYGGISVAFETADHERKLRRTTCLSQIEPGAAHMMVVRRANRQDHTFPISYDPETQRMYDPEPITKMISVTSSTSSATTTVGGVHDRHHAHGPYSKKPAVTYKHWYALGACKFMELFNEIMDANLSLLEDNACEHAWRSPALAAAYAPAPAALVGPSSTTTATTNSNPSTTTSTTRSLPTATPHSFTTTSRKATESSYKANTAVTTRSLTDPVFVHDEEVQIISC